MLIIGSDLHLVDHPARGSFDVAAFLDLVGSLAVRKPGDGDDTVRLVLLGDIFELLKADAWHGTAVRPWSAPGPELSSVSCKILQAIHDASQEFFDGLRRLQRDQGLSITYLPGNHDALIGDEALTGVRQLLRSLLPGLEGHDDQPFQWMYLDEEHGVVAEHGHLLDRFNQRCNGSRFVPGDAVVVELLVQLPIQVASEIGAIDPQSAQFSPEYAFLHEMDNVEPQTLEGFMCWLEYQMHDVASRKSIEAALARALHCCISNLHRAMTTHGAAAFVCNLLRMLLSHREFTKMPALRLLAKLPVAAATNMSAVASRVDLIGEVTSFWERPPDLYVAGHTHAPLQQGFSAFSGHRMTYLNCGTWRRVQSPALSRGRVIFDESCQETLLCVHRTRLAAKKKRYELSRNVRG